MIGPFFQQKIYEWPYFSGFLCERPHFSDILVYAHIFRSDIFRGCLSSWYYMNWLWYLCNNQQKMDTKKSKDSIWIGQHFGWSSIWMGPFFQRPGIWMGRFWNTGSHTRTKITLVTPTIPPPHPSETHTHTHTNNNKNIFQCFLLQFWMAHSELNYNLSALTVYIAAPVCDIVNIHDETIFCHLLLDLHVKIGTRFSLRDKRFFEMSDVEITRVNCTKKQIVKLV